MFNKLHVECCK